MYLEDDEVKFAILYTGWRYNMPISLEVMRFILVAHHENDILDYFTFAINFNQLLEDGFFRKTFTADEEKYELTQKGGEAVSFFRGRVPPSVRRHIDKQISKIQYSLLIDTTEISAECACVDTNEGYVLRCGLTDSMERLLDMNIYIGGKKAAQKARESFKNNAVDIYKEILRIMQKDFEDGA